VKYTEQNRTSNHPSSRQLTGSLAFGLVSNLSQVSPSEGLPVLTLWAGADRIGLVAGLVQRSACRHIQSHACASESKHGHCITVSGSTACSDLVRLDCCRQTTILFVQQGEPADLVLSGIQEQWYSASHAPAHAKAATWGCHQIACMQVLQWRA
jgi:hypothetical protein